MFVPKSALAIVSHCDAESSRYALGAVQFERDTDGKAIAVATDGRRLAMLSWPDADIMPAEERTLERAAIADIGLAVEPVAEFKALLNMADLKSAGKMLTAKPSLQSAKPHLGSIIIDEVSANGKVTMGATNGSSPSSMTVASTDGRFPKWRDVFPDTYNKVSVKIDPKYLAEACNLLRDFATTDDARGVVLTLHTDKYGNGAADNPIVVSAERADGRIGKCLIMPLASDR